MRDCWVRQGVVLFVSKLFMMIVKWHSFVANTINPNHCLSFSESHCCSCIDMVGRALIFYEVVTFVACCTQQMLQHESR